MVNPADAQGVLHAPAGAVDRTGKPPRVAVYCRVSSDEQAQAGMIENQLDFARRYCDLHGLLVHDFYTDEGMSGTLAVDERPNGKRLLADARAGKLIAVLVYRVDRFARSTLHLLHAHDVLRRAGVTLRSMTEPSIRPRRWASS